MKQVFLLVLFIILFPVATHASVIISEIAWMGSADNANAEWIELYNDGPEQDLSGWTLSAIDGQPAILLSGTMAENSHALLERTTDDTVTNVVAFLVYTGALGNAGEVLELRNDTNMLVDRVDGSSDWVVGGSNDTKETLQRSGTPPVGGWTTAPATPDGSTPVYTNMDDGDAQDDTETSTGTQSSFGGGVLYGSTASGDNKVLREPALTLDLGDARMVTVGILTGYSARTYRESGKEVVMQQVMWNFGDGSTAKGKTVKHAFQYPGKYVVTAHACRTGFLDEVCDDARVVVTAVAPTVEIVEVTGDYVEVKNTSTYELDISGFVLGAGSQFFRVPVGTVLLPKTSVKFPARTTELATAPSSGVVAYHSSGATMARSVSEQFATIPVRRTAVASRQMIAPVNVTQAMTANEEEEYKGGSANLALASVALPALVPVAQAFGGTNKDTTDTQGGSIWWWLLGVLATVLIVVFSFFFIRTEEKELIEGLEIESDE